MCVWISEFHTMYFPFFCHVRSLELPCWLALEEDAGENKMKSDTLVVSRDWMGRVKKMWASPRVVKISVWTDESQRRVQRKKWKWVNRGREICCICLNLRAIRFRTNSGGVLSPAFGQFMIADTSHLGQRRSVKAIWKRVSPKQPVKLGDHPSTSWFVAALLFHSTLVLMMRDYSPITSLPGMHIESKIRGRKKTLLKQSVDPIITQKRQQPNCVACCWNPCSCLCCLTGGCSDLWASISKNGTLDLNSESQIPRPHST